MRGRRVRPVIRKNFDGFISRCLAGDEVTLTPSRVDTTLKAERFYVDAAAIAGCFGKHQDLNDRVYLTLE
jgi:hypothetical protein